MMNGYPSIAQAMQQAGSAGWPAAGQCRCQQGCVCQPGQPCRCSSGCSCSHASAASQASLRTRNWIESGENEMRRRSSRGVWLRTRARIMLQQRVARQNDWTRRAQLNGSFARRFNWGPQMGPVSRVIGSPYPQPDSRRFMFALARWQQRHGLPVTGILSPSIWRRLLAILQAYPVHSGPIVTGGWPQPRPEPGYPPYGSNGAGGPGASYGANDGYGANGSDGGAADSAGPAMAGGADDGAMPLPGDAGEPGDGSGPGPEPAGNEFAPVGFRNRRNYAQAQHAMGQP